MRNKKLPTISVVIATHNSARTIRQCLTSIRAQRYPKGYLEIIVVDGASTDKTRAIARRFGVKLIAVDPSKQSAEHNKAVGIRCARNDIIAMIDHDNILPHDRWLQVMVLPFLERKDVVGVETLRYQYDPKTSPLDRYFALLGAGDPLVWYLGKADRLSYMYDTYRGAEDWEDRGTYYVVRFTPENIPTIGANGFLVRRDVLLKYAKTSPGLYFDMDVNVDLIVNGYNTYAFVKDSILHLTGYAHILNFLKRRMLFLSQYRFGYDGEKIRAVRRYGKLSKRDVGRLLWAIIACATVIVPLYDSMRGWRKVRDWAWVLHPVLSVCFVAMYTYAVARQSIFLYGKKLLAK